MNTSKNMKELYRVASKPHNPPKSQNTTAVPQRIKENSSGTRTLFRTDQ